MKNILTMISLLMAQTSYASLDYTALRVSTKFSPVLTSPHQIEKMQVSCIFRDLSNLTGDIQVDPNDSQRLETVFKYQTATKKFELSTQKGNIKSVDVSLGEQVIEKNGLGRGPNPWIMIWGDDNQSLSLSFYFWFGNFQMNHSDKTITMASGTAPFSYIDRPVYDENPGKCVWKIDLK